MSQVFQLKGGSRVSKASWPIEAKIGVLAAVKSGKTAQAAIAEVAMEFEIDLKPSYTKNAGSHLYRFRKEITTALAKEKVSAEALTMLQDADLVSPVEATETASS
jgi:hypothetical protein